MLAQIDITQLGTNPKMWLTVIGGVLLSLIVGRFIQAFKAGGGIADAAKAVWAGTNSALQSISPEDVKTILDFIKQQKSESEAVKKAIQSIPVAPERDTKTP